MQIKAKAAVAEAEKAAEASELKKKTFQRLFNNTKKKLTCAAASKTKLQVELKSIRAVSTREAQILAQQMGNYKSELQHVEQKLQETQLLLKAAHRKICHMRLTHLKLK